MQTVSALARTARHLAEALPDHIGLFGHSGGGATVLGHVLRAGNVSDGGARLGTETNLSQCRRSIRRLGFVVGTNGLVQSTARRRQEDQIAA